MDRRAFLRAGAGTASVAALAGCTGLFETRSVSTGVPPVVENRPEAVYYPSHVEGMEVYGTHPLRSGTLDSPGDAGRAGAWNRSGCHR
ncbi:hypothetical protein BRC90_05255 [Halobacteriales archaeon QS_4_69_34]|nr:MAG: hypothetical protein BRC90_05255 [Halobacteriales archaeon QS_4_69_34]